MANNRRQSNGSLASDAELQVRYEDLDQLATYMRDDNPKDHDIAAIRGSVDAVGYIDPLLTNDAPGGGLLAGHGRIKALQAMRNAGEDAPIGVHITADGRWMVPVLHGVALTAEQADRYLIAANQTTILGGWNDSLLAFLERLDAEADGLLGSGFGEDDLGGLRAALARSVGGLADPEAVPEPGEVTVQRGEIYALGGSRIMCGDATTAADVEQLLDGARPRLMPTDPPYGVGYDATWRDAVVGQVKARRGAVRNDDRADWREAWALSPADVAYVWHGGLHAGEVQASLESAGFELRAQIVWVKQSLVFGRGAYHWRHEPCFYAVRKGASASWIGDRKQTTVWEIPNSNLHAGGAKDDADTDHSTQKAVECMERAIRNHAGDVYDPFCGVGTSIIAALHQGRRCFAMDIEPKWVQTAIERWQNYTGQVAINVETGVPYAVGQPRATHE